MVEENEKLVEELEKEYLWLKYLQYLISCCVENKFYKNERAEALRNTTKECQICLDAVDAFLMSTVPQK